MRLLKEYIEWRNKERRKKQEEGRKKKKKKEMKSSWKVLMYGQYGIIGIFGNIRIANRASQFQLRNEERADCMLQIRYIDTKIELNCTM